MANGGRIDYSIGFNVDKTGLNQIKSSLQEIKNLTAQDLMKIGGHTDIQKAEQELKNLKTSISQIDDALEKAFNTDLGTLNVSKFNQALKGMNLNQVYKDFSAAGAAGQTAFRNVTSQILTTNMQLKQTHNFLNNMATTMANTVKWGVASSVMNNFTGSVQKAYGYVKSLDTSLNDIRIVTNKSAEEMDKFAVKANNAAKALGKSTTDYTNASLIYYQQGLSDKDVAARAETTLKAANVTGQSGEAVSEQLTAVWNGYKVSAEEAELYIDKLAAVAATTASDLEELSTGMSKVASAANLMGVDIDSLNAQMATIVSVTRQAPESVGTALKTIYARMGDIEAGLDAETTLGNYTEEMKAMGVNVLDASGKLRDMGDVINEIGGNWKNMTREQQLSLSQTMAGTRQYNNLLSLFDNWDMYTDALNTSANAAGTLQKQQDIYMESTQAHLNQLRAASEDLYDSLLDPKGLNPVIDGLTLMTNLFSNFVDSIGGGGNILLALGSIGTKVFSQQLASGIATFITNLQNAKDNAAQLRAELEITQKYQNSNINDSQIKILVDMKKQVLDLDKSITNEERNIANEYINQQNELYKQQDALKQKAQEAQKLYENLTGTSISVDPNSGKGAANLGKELLKEAGEFEQYTTQANATRKSILELTAARRQFEEARGKTISFAAQAKDFQPYQKAIDDTKQKIQDYIKMISSLQNKGKLSPQGVEDVNKSYEKLKQVVGDVNQIQLSNGKHVTALKAYYEETSSAIQKTGSSIVSLAHDMDSLESQLSDNKKYITELQQSYTNFLNGIELRSKIQQNLQLVSSFGQLASAMTSIGNMDSIWSNESLSAGEKMLQTVTNLGFAVPMLANSLGKILPLETAIGAARTKQIATLVIRNGLETSYNALVQKGVPQQLALDAALAKKNGNTAFYNQLLTIQIKLNHGVALSESEQIFLDEALAASKRKVGLAAIFAQGGLKAFWGALGLMGQLTVIVVALAAAAKAFDHFHISAKEAGEAVSDSLSELESSTTELENLESSLQGVQDKLDELHSKDELSITDKEDIANLEKERIELETQLALQKEINAEKQKQVANDAKQAIDKGTFEHDAIYEVGKGQFIDVSTEETRDAWIEEQVGKRGEDHRERATELANEYYDKYHSEFVNSLAEDYDILIASLDALKETGGSEEDIAYLQNKITEYYNAMGTLDDTVLSSMDSVFQGDTAQQNQFHEALQSGDPTADSGWTDEDLAKAGLAEEQIEALKTAADAAGISLDTLVNTFAGLGNEQIAGNLENTIDKIHQLSELQGNNGSELYEDVIRNDIAELKEEGFDDDFINRAIENIDFSQVDFNSLEEGAQNSFETALRNALENQKEMDIDSLMQDRFETDSENFDIDLEEYEDLTEYLQDSADAVDGLSEELEDNGLAAQEVAKDLLRYDKALESVQENSEDWMDILEGGNLQDHAGVLDEIAEAYGNLLDIDGSALSQSFLENAENLELLQQAAEGSEEAYRQLQAAAAQDILLSLGYTGDEALAQFQNDLAWIQGYDSSVFGNIADLEVGASLNDSSFLQGLTDMVNAAGMSATQATDYLSSMGVDAEVIEDTTTGQEQQEYVGADARITTQSVTYNNPLDPNLASVTTTVPDITYEPIYETVTASKENKAYSLKVVSANKSSGGGFKHTNTSHGGGGSKSPKKSGKKGGGGGGGSKGSQPKKAKKQDLMEKTVDRYREVNNELKKLENQMNRLTKAQDHLFGKDLYDNLNKQLKLLDKQVAATERKLELARQERRELQKQLENYGFNIQNYEIQNYEQQLEKYRKDVNDLIKQYNNLSGDEQQGEAGEALQEKIDAAKEKYDKIEELIEEWTNLQFDLIPELKETILDLAYQKIEIQLEKFNISVELNLDLRDAIADWHDFEKKIYGAADNLAESSQRSLDYINKIYDAGILEKQTEDLRLAREELAKIRADENYVSDIYTAKNPDGTPMLDENGKPITDEKAAVENVEKLQSELMDTIESIYDETDQILDNYVQSVEDLADAIDRYYDALEGVRDVIDHTMNMMKMIHGEDSSVMAQVYDKQLNSTKDLVQATKDNSAKLKGLISEQQSSLQDTNSKISNLQSQQSTQSSELEGMYKEDMTDEEKTAYENKKQELANTELQLANYERIKAAEEEALKTSEEAYQENLAMQRQYVEDYTQMLLEQYEYTINQASKKFTQSLVGSMGMEGAQYEWDNLAREEDKYLDEINTAYELRKLERKINEDISGNDSVAAQQRLNKFKEEELKKLREKDKLTKYDVDRANQLYDIELKKIALLESQNNKSKMRLRRDASGNYSYQFVADEEDVAKKQQELDDATNELYNMDKDQYRKELQDLQALHKEYEDFRVWYSQQSAEFREANEAWYKQQCQMYEDQMVDSARLAEEAKQNTVESANMTIVNSSRDTMNEMTTMYNEAILEEILPTWRSSIAEMCEFINTSESSFRANSEEAMNAVFEASDQLISKLQELSNVVGGDLTEVTSQYYTNAEAEAKSYAQQQQENIDKTWEQVQANKALVDSMEDVLNQQQLQDAVTEAGKAEEDLENIYQEELKEPSSGGDNNQKDDGKKDNKDEDKKNNKDNQKSGSLKVGEDITYKGSYYYDSYGTKPTGSKGAEVKNAVVIDKIVKNPKDGQKWSVHIKGNPKKDKYKGYTDLGWIKKSQITAYDTGGYTGAWNSRNGKMAMLHEKELVLNKEDTANILAVVKMVRDLVSMPYSNGSEEEYHIPLELQKVYDAILEKLDILTNSLISNEDLQASIENGLISDNEEDLLNEQLTTEDVLSDVEELENLTSTVGDELEEATTLLDGVQENLTSQMDLQNLQNFNLEELGLQQMDLFGSLENFMGTDFISQIESYIEDFKSQMSIQSDKSMMMSNEQLQGIQKQLEALAAQFMQEVNINAEFPNVTDSSEIQFAFDNMENEASQYALNTSGGAFNWMGSR